MGKVPVRPGQFPPDTCRERLSSSGPNDLRFAILQAELPSQLQIREHSNGLTLTSLSRFSVWEIVLVTSVLSAGAGYFAFRVLRGLIALILAVPLGWLVYRQVRRGQAAELLATNLEFRMSQRYWIFGPHRAISRANIVDLEYRPERGGGDAGSDPSGLYANLKFNASVCLLPYLDEPGTNAAIEAIYRHFPDMPIAYDKRGLGEHFIRLGL